MKKIILLGLLIIVLFTSLLLINLNIKYYDDENTLYSIEFGNTKLRVERYDYALG